jgi:hypothetical protein
MDDIFSRKADILFQKHGIQGVSKPAADTKKVAGDEFKKDFLQEIQNAALEIAKARRIETEQRIAELNGLIESASVQDDQVLVNALEQEKKALETMLPDLPS